MGTKALALQATFLEANGVVQQDVSEMADK